MGSWIVYCGDEDWLLTAGMMIIEYLCSCFQQDFLISLRSFASFIFSDPLLKSIFHFDLVWVCF